MAKQSFRDYSLAIEDAIAQKINPGPRAGTGLEKEAKRG